MKLRFDKKAKFRFFFSPREVLVLLPVQGDALMAKFCGPCIIERKVSDVTYVVRTPDRGKPQRLCHLNMLKKYYKRYGSCKPIGFIKLSNEGECCPPELDEDTCTVKVYHQYQNFLMILMVNYII